MPSTTNALLGHTLHELDANPQIQKYFDRSLTRTDKYTILTLKRKSTTIEHEQLPNQAGRQQVNSAAA